MAFDRLAHPAETGDEVMAPAVSASLAPGSVMRSGIAQKFTPPDFLALHWPRLAGGRS